MAKNKNITLWNFCSRLLSCIMPKEPCILQLKCESGVKQSIISGWVKQHSPIKVSEEETVTLKEHKALQKTMPKG